MLPTPQNKKTTLDHLTYDHDSGEFYSHHPRTKDQTKPIYSIRHMGISKTPTKVIKFRGKTWLAKRLAWFFIHGSDAWGNILQKDCNFLNCKMENLFEQTGKKKTSWKRDTLINTEPNLDGFLIPKTEINENETIETHFADMANLATKYKRMKK